MNTTATPLVWTSLGNMPAADLAYSTRWEDTPEYTKFVETYTYNGEVVRESAHVLSKKGAPIEGQQAVF